MTAFLLVVLLVAVAGAWVLRPRPQHVERRRPSWDLTRRPFLLERRGPRIQTRANGRSIIIDEEEKP